MDDRHVNAKHRCPYLNTVQAAEFLNLSPRTLEKMRISGDGPPYHKHGNRVFYTLPELIAWSNARMKRSTSDHHLRKSR